jgi:uncharacterized protein (TIGR00369 family)
MNPIKRSPFANYLGFELVEATAGKAVVSVELTQRLQNRRGVAHGGMTATLLDMAMGLACRSPAGEWTNEGTVTLNVHFMLPGRGRLVAEGRVLKAGNTVVFTEGEVRNEAGAMVAKATGTFKIVRRPSLPAEAKPAAAEAASPAEEGDSGGNDFGQS